jgi:hypothetical protein
MGPKTKWDSEHSRICQETRETDVGDRSCGKKRGVVEGVRKEGWMGFFNWLKNKEDTIKRFNDIFSIFASSAALILFVITIIQLSDASNNLKANTIYSIAKDGRELSENISKMVKNNEFNYGYVFNYVHSVWHQKRLGTLDNRLWMPIENEVCLFLAHNPEANSYWNKDTKKLFDPEFVDFIEKVGEREECKGKKGGKS